MHSVDVAELKNRLSKYLTFARAVEEVVIRDRNLPVAKLVPLSAEGAGGLLLEKLRPFSFDRPNLRTELWTRPKRLRSLPTEKSGRNPGNFRSFSYHKKQDPAQ